MNHFINAFPRKIVLWGGASLTEMLRETIEYYGSSIAMIIDDTPGKKSLFPDIPICEGIEPFKNWVKGQNRKNLEFIVTIGGCHGRIKLEKAKLLEAEGLEPVSIVHHTAWVAKDAEIGVGTIIDAGSIVMAKAKIGKHCIIGPGCNIGHHDEIGDATDVSCGDTVCGFVTVGKCVWIGAGACIHPRLTIGDDATVGLGSVVLKDVPPGVMVLGNPARQFVTR